MKLFEVLEQAVKDKKVICFGRSKRKTINWEIWGVKFWNPTDGHGNYFLFPDQEVSLNTAGDAYQVLDMNGRPDRFSIEEPSK